MWNSSGFDQEIVVQKQNTFSRDSMWNPSGFDQKIVSQHESTTGLSRLIKATGGALAVFFLILWSNKNGETKLGQEQNPKK